VGSAFADSLVGDAGANRLNGGVGADILTGREGADILSGGVGADWFVFLTAALGAATADQITDFVTDLDEIRLENAVFTTLGVAGNLALGAFRANSTGLASDAD
jgi:Ca2+-binding RTX toxin-like protein